MHQHLRGQLFVAALACLCVLLVNCGATRAENEPLNKEAPEVAKILNSSEEDKSAVEPSLEAKKDVEVPKELAARDGSGSKQSVASIGSPAKPTDASEAAPDAASRQATSQEVAKELKDLKSLLENKNDAENDLGPSPVASGSSPGEPKPELAPAVIKTQFASEASTDAEKPLDERFHYSLGAEKPLEGKKEDPASGVLKPKLEESAKPAAAAPNDEELDEPAKKGEGETEDDEKEAESGPASTSSKAPEGSTSTTTESASTTTSTERPESVVVVTKVEEEKPSTTSTTTTALPPVDSTGKPAVRESEVAPSGQAASVAPATEAANKDSSGASTTPSEASSSATTTTMGPPSTPLSAKSDAQERPSIISSASSIATAAAATAGSSLGSAVGSAIGSNIANKDRPSETKPVAGAPVPPASSSPSTTTSSTTKAPGGRRKSTTDRWNRWQPSSPPSASEAPPTRRRPVLPSIRRRFRPYNRFGPFPWAPSGPEVYSPGQPYETPLNADAEPDFGRPSLDKTTRPARRRSTTELPSWISSTARPRTSTPESNDDGEPSPSVSTRRQPADGSFSGSGRRQPSSTNRWSDNDWSQGGGSVPDPFESSHSWDSDRHRPPHRRYHKHHHRPRNDERPYLSEPSLLNPARAQSPAFDLFNSAGSPSTGSGFDILNPFSWVDEITKPLRPSYHHNRPGLESARPGGPHSGQAGRPTGPVPVEGEYNSGRPSDFEGGVAEHPQRGGHHEHDHHHDHHRPHRPVGAGGRDDYYDDHHHDCHHEHEHDHDHDHHHDHGRPHRPTPTDGYEDYASGGAGRRPIGAGRRPDRPYYNRRDQPTSTSASASHGSTSGVHSSRGGHSNSADSTIVRDNETLNSAGERLANRGSERQVAGSPSLRRVPMFSPFDSLFGTLDDDLFGGLRSSFVDAPMKASGEVVSRFDAIVNSPKISLPAGAGGATSAEQTGRTSAGQSAAPASGATNNESVPKVDEVSVKPVDKREPKAMSEDSPARANRGGIRHFLLMI